MQGILTFNLQSMKKFYLLTLVACITGAAITALAGITPRKTMLEAHGLKSTLELSQATSINKSATQKTESAQILSMKRVDDGKNFVKRAADDKFSIEGEYIMEINDVYFQEGEGKVEIQAEIYYDSASQWYWISDLSETMFASDVPFEFDEATNTLTFFQVDFGQVQVGPSSYYYVILSPFHYVTGSGVTLLEEWDVKFNPENGNIEFPTSFYGFAWPAYTDRNYTNLAGYLGLFDVTAAYPAVPIDEEQPGQWKTLGNATFVDGWALPGYGMNPADYPYEVELQQNLENSNIYRLWEPYKNSPLASVNQSKYKGQIVFDISDPEHVIIFTGYPSGFGDEDGEMYDFGLLGWQINGFGNQYTPDYFDMIVDFMEENDQPFDTFKDGVLTVNKPVFAYSRSCAEAYSWNTTYPASIKFPEISGGGETVEATGKMTAQLDMNQGTGNPDLLEAETWDVTASFNPTTNELTINNFAALNPVVFTIDLESGKAEAKGEQIAEIDGDDDDAITYYYSDVASNDFGMKGQLISLGNGKCMLSVDPWGEGNEFPGFGFYINSAYYNTEVTLNMSYPGEEEGPSIEGEWEIETDWHYAGDWSLGLQKDIYTAVLEGTTVTFTNDFGDVFVAELTAKNTLTFNVAVVGNPDAASPKTQAPFVDGSKVTDAGIDGENFDFRSFNATFNLEAGTITFPAGSGIAYGYATDGVFSYYEDAFDFVSARRPGAPAPEYGDPSIEGDWNIELDGHYQGEYSLGKFTDTYVATLEGNIVRFVGTDKYDIVAEFTAENTLKFNKCAVGPQATNTLFQVPYINTTGIDVVGDLMEQSFTATYNAENGTITFPEGSGLAYGYYDEAGNLSFWDDAFDFIDAARITNDEIIGTYNWTLLATDFEGSTSGESVNVQVTVNKTDDTHYYFEEIGNGNYFNGQTIPFTYNHNTQIAQFEAFYAGDVEGKPTWFSAFILNKDNLEMGTFIEPQPTFALQFDAANGFQFTGETGFAWYFTSSSTGFDAEDVYKAYYVNPDFSSVGSIEAVESGEVRFFNLQGVEVKNPAKGEIIIRVEGNKATKVIM